jgi:subtilisin family serine protease
MLTLPARRRAPAAPPVRAARPTLEALETRTAPAVVSVAGAPTPNDPLLGSLWGLRNVDAPGAWSVTTGSTAVTVGIIDSGIDYDHPDLYRNIWLNEGEIPATRRENLTDTDGDGLITFWDLNDPINQGPGKITDLNGDGRVSAGDVLAPMVKGPSGQDLGTGGWANGGSDDGDTYADDLVGWDFLGWDNKPYDDNGHGTHVAGTVGALADNGTGVAGVAWRVRLMPLKFLSAHGSGYTSDAAAALRYAVAHGADLSNNSWGGHGDDPGLYAAIRDARDAGHVVVAAAGNGGSSIDAGPFYPAAYDLDNIVSVAATDPYDSLAGFSNYGAAGVDLAAPGVSILSTTPGGGYASWNGTSMAAPHVSGALALVRSLHPDWTYQQSIEQVLATVDKVPALAGRTATGGRLDAAQAVGAPASYTPPAPPPYSPPPSNPPAAPPPAAPSPPPPESSPIGAWVQALYRDLLGRSIDGAGLAYWVGQVQGGVPRDQVVRAFWNTPEHRGFQVDQYFQTFLHRPADPGARAYWVGRFLSGAGELEVMRGFLTSPEYAALHGDDGSFVAGMYQDALGRPGESSGLAYWSQAVTRNGRSGAAAAFLSAGETLGGMVDNLYRTYLDRPIDGAGLGYWVGVIQAGRAPLAGVGVMLLASDEYFARG